MVDVKDWNVFHSPTMTDTKARVIARPIYRSNAGSAQPFDPALWNHPTLALYQPEPEPTPKIPSKLYLVPTPNLIPGEEVDPEFPPKPSNLADLPQLTPWVERFVVGVVEIWGGRRDPVQLSRWCHRSVYSQLLRRSGSMKTIPRVRKIYLSQPLEGICETTVTIRIGERVRSLILRFEGVDHRWLCTELVLL